jgi:eukaryotic-like serine/threonine-protein kinase
MGLTSGTKLGPYEIQSPLGAGGMGEVYRARDTRLERTVAIKILPEHLSGSPEARQRFDREARAISSLSHPNICHLYDVGQQEATSYLVMEYLEGETLAERLRKGPLPLGQVLRVGIEICEGLEKAHRSGVVHRDLKPGNIMLTKSGAKLMDFGLAKAPAGALKGPFSSNSLATMSQPLTTEGTIVGTIQYMAPEQVEGKEADARSDIFSLGAVLYEMVTGKRAFEGKTTASTIAAILAAEPKPISAVQPLSPPALEHLIKTCLAKDPDERLQTAHDVKVQLQWIAQGASAGGVAAAKPAARAIPNRLAWLLVGLLAVMVAGGGVAWWASAHRTPPAMYFSSPISLIANDIALSPDARTVALVAYSEQAKKYVIWKYEVGSRQAVVIPGTEEASHPFWSPDGKAIAFFADGKLKKVDAISGMSAQVICDAPNGRGGAWNRGGVILFTPDAFRGIHRVSSAGGTPVEITKLDPSRLETSHRWPVFLPDQRHFLYLAANFSGEFEKNAIFVGSLDSNETHLVVSASSNSAYAEPGYLLYIRNNALVAQHFDLRTLSVSGEPRIISDEVQYTPTTDLAVFTVSGQALVVQTGKGVGTSQFLWFNRSGKPLGDAGPPGLLGNPALSPDGRRVLFDQMEPDGRHWDIWIRELASDATTRLTFGPGLNQLPVWSPDGKQVLYSAIRHEDWRLITKNADGSGTERQVSDEAIYLLGPWDWSRDGKILMWKNGELWYVPLSDSQTQPKPIIRENWIVRNAQFSPDGKWLAYSSNEAGNWEIYVSPFPRADNKWQVSRGGGVEPRWRKDGKELFYISADGKMIAVPVKTNTTFEAGPPLTLFQTYRRQPISALDRVSYDVTADGQRFLVDTKVDEPNAAPLSVILNWASEMEK